MKVFLADQGEIGRSVLARYSLENSFIGLQYPEDTFDEHLWQIGLWVGAKVDTGSPSQPKMLELVTTTNEGDSINLLCDNVSNTITSDSLHPWNHFSNLHDSAATSESDYTCEYTDTATGPLFRGHIPLGIKVFQRSYAWAAAVRVPILPFDYTLVNIGNRVLRDVYFGFYIFPTIYSAGKPFGNTYGIDRNYHGYWPDVRTVYVHNPLEEMTTPFGVTILGMPKPLDSLNYFFRRLPVTSGTSVDTIRYLMLTGQYNYPVENPIMPDQPITDLTSSFDIVSFGPVSVWSPGETLRVSMAVVGGQSLKFNADNLYDNARFAQTLYNRHYKPPVVLSAPKLSIEYGSSELNDRSGNSQVVLRWSPSAVSNNPQEYWDDENSVASFYPPDHWRRRNPPPNSTTGGRVFEGYRLYRSEDPSGTANSFTLIKQWDIADSVGPKYGYDIGIETTYVDTNLRINKTYWYAVTSFGIPDLHVIEYLDFDGIVKKETLNTPSAETPVLASRKRVNLSFSISHEANKVLVVPNPYKVNENYTFEGGGWEGRGKTWSENKRLLKFIHLPPKCTIHIYTIAGDVITTLHHDDLIRGEEDWNLLSESNRAIASGVYVFSVESDYGTQIGKFVVIR